ncbi:MAG TPA: deoxyribodipyrimidine photo-lyase [Rhizomicrobium sp.]|jgi:deoxyribodipyrimidine photo-lyase|nr:deoxyribodipyrimidine photo-lyase [Rhizomicrobium sp.]
MNPVIVWFRQDLRLADNPALTHAMATGAPVLGLYVLDDETPGAWRLGGASRWWLHESLQALSSNLAEICGRLILRRGRADTAVASLAKEVGAAGVVWNRCYEPYAVERDKRLKADLTQAGIAADSFNGSLLAEPWEVRTGAGTPFKVYTPFWRALRALPDSGKPLPAPKAITPFVGKVATDRLADWALLPHKPDWAGGLRETWMPGEAGARKRLSRFLKHLKGYRAARDRPDDDDGTSHLSPHLHFGEISPRQVRHAVQTGEHGDDGDKFLSELGWREFSYHLLFHNPALPEAPLDAKFAHFPWTGSDAQFKAWSKGQTGYPIVDAGMRQLWHTGYMHNRVRMIAASFLIKHLAIDWRRGEAWFWDTLVDADLANNAASWQWVAGCGADAAPFFRIFNPVLQGEKFDPDGAYVRCWVPELAGLADKFIHKPWLAPTPPENYPEPIVDLAEGRARALAAFKGLSRE